MKRFLLIAGIVAFFTGIAQAQHLQNPTSTENSLQNKELLVTKAGFLKQLTAIHQNDINDTLEVTFISGTKDPRAVLFNGSSNADMSKLLETLQPGDRIVLHSKNKRNVALPSFLIK